MRPRAASFGRALLAAALLAAALVAGCARQPDLAPRPARLVPAGARPGATAPVRILGAGFFARAVQSSGGAAVSLDAAHRAWFDDDEVNGLVTDLTWLGTGELAGRAPALAPGVHALTVENALGLRGTLQAAFTVAEPAALSLSASLGRGRASVGQQGLQLTVLATNTAPPGSAAILGARVTVAAAGVGAVAGAATSDPFDLAPGASHQEAFALAAPSPGEARFGATVSGADAVSGEPVTAAAADAVLLVQARAALFAALAVPSTIAGGAPFQVTMTVQNRGEAAALDVAPGALQPVASATGLFSQVSGPSPAAATVPGGGQATFTWTWQLAGPGTVELLGGAGGTDANDGLPVTAEPVESNEASQSLEVVHLAEDPFGDGTAVAALAAWRGEAWVGPRNDGRVFWHVAPAPGSGGGVLPVSIAVDAGATPAENVGWRGSPTADTFGMPGCVANSTTCGPSGENGRGVLASGTFLGDEWLLYAGASTIRARFVYLARQAGPPISFAAVDLQSVLETTALAPTAVAFAPAASGGADRIYLAFTDQAAKKSPRLVALSTAPAGPVLDAVAPGDVLDLAVARAPGVGGDAGLLSNPDAEPRVEAMAWFRDRLYLATGSALLRGAVVAPGPFAAAPADWSPTTPLHPAWLLRRGLPAASSTALTPADRAVPAMAAFGRCGAGPCLYLVRNVTGTAPAVVPQLWACHPGQGGDPAACDPGDWSLAAADAGGDATLTQLGVATNGAASLLLATDHYLYLGFDNAATGAQVYRTEVAPASRDDFRGRDGCVAGGAGCQGLGGNGLGLGTAVTRIFDARAVSAGGATTVFVAAGNASGALHLFAFPE